MKDKIKLPDFKVENVISALSEVVDWGIAQQHVPETWKTAMGEGVTIYVLDTGCSNHMDLSENSICGGGFVDGENDNDNLSGHSTHCAGTIAANKNNMGVVGVAPKAKIVFVKCLGDSGSGALSSVVEALKYCVNAKDGKIDGLPPPDIISMSLGSQSPIRSIHNQIKELYKRNVPVICATGNQGGEVFFPAKFPETIAVGAYDPNENVAKFSNYGPEVDFVAPGVGIYSTYLNNRYAKLTGTSMATPFVAGVIALMLSKHKKQEKKTGENDCQTVEEIRNHLIKYSIDMGEKGKDDKFGYGIIDVPKLIAHGQNITLPRNKTRKSILQGLILYFKRLFVN